MWWLAALPLASASGPQYYLAAPAVAPAASNLDTRAPPLVVAGPAVQSEFAGPEPTTQFGAPALVVALAVGCGLALRPQRRMGAPGRAAPALPRTGAVVMMPKMKKSKFTQVVLTKGVAGLGKGGEVVSVKHPYAENVLLPQGLAAPATPQVLEEIAAKVAAAEAARAAAVAEAKQKEAKLVATFGDSGCFIEKKVGPDGGIFGSVTAAELVDLLANKAGVAVDKKDVSVPEISPEKDLELPALKPGQKSVKVAGTAVADIKFHPEVVSKLKINVIPEE